MSRTTMVTSVSLGGRGNSQPHDPAGARTQDLRIKRCRVHSLLYDAITTCDGRCDDRWDTVEGDASGASVRRGSLRGHPKPLLLGGANVGPRFR